MSGEPLGAEAPQYWFNVRTGAVQTTYDKGQSRDLLGPYPTAEAARGALTSAARRTEEWDEEDRRWNEGRPHS